MLKTRRSVLISLLIVFLAIWITTLTLSLEDRSRVLAQSTERIERLAKIAALHAERTFFGADILARYLALEYVEHGAAKDLSSLLFQPDRDTRLYPQFGIINSQGIYTSNIRTPPDRADFNDTPSFLHHKRASGDPFLIERIVDGRFSEKLSIQVTRRIDKPEKGFIGVAVVSFAPQYFAELYFDLVSPRRVMYLVGNDGNAWTEYTGAQLKVDRDVRSTEWFQEIEKQPGKNAGLIKISNQNHTTDYYAYHRVSGFPLTVVIADSHDVMFANYLVADKSRNLAAIFMSILLGILFIVLEISARKLSQYADSMQLQTKKLTSALDVKAVFIRNISHELRTPLAGITAGADYIKTFTDAEDMRETAQSILTASDHLKNIVDNLLTLSAVGSSPSLPGKEKVNVLDVISDIIAINHADASRKGLALNLKPPDIDLPLVAISKTALMQVLQNLTHNAIKFTDRGGVAIDVQLARKFVKIVVEDTGAGISPEDIPKLFKQFSQLEQFGSRPNSGTGLGLYLSAQLVESFGGWMGLESTLGMGSKFCVVLPFSEDENECRHSA